MTEMPPLTDWLESEERSARGAFLRDALRGLRTRPKSLPSKYLYDARGSALFEQICDLAEYYPTRTETSILEEHASEMAAALGPNCRLVEWGSGSSTKTRLLIDAMHPSTVYVPVDISPAALVPAAADIASKFPWIEVHPVLADFTHPFELPETQRDVYTNAVFFPGSTIGNFHSDEALALLANAADFCGQGGAMLLGADLKKDPAILEQAYDDTRGVTAAFNLNVLHRMNRELGADFDAGHFGHCALWNEDLGRMEMHLVSLRNQVAHLCGVEIRFAIGETIHTECSYKYEIAELSALAGMAGFDVERVWTDDRAWFGVLLLRARGT